MIAHIGFTVSNIQKTKELYEKALAPLNIVPVMSGDGYVAFGQPNNLELWLGESSERHQKVATDIHVCFLAQSRSVVDSFYAEGLKAGFIDNGAPGIREQYSPNYYAAFLIDNDGNNIEAVCFAE